MPAWWSFAVALLVLPTASAAVLTFGTPQVSGSPIVVDSGRMTFLVPAQYVCEASEASVSGAELDVQFADVPQGISVTGPGVFAIPDSACKGPESKPWMQDLQFEAFASAAAAGEKALMFTVNGRVKDGGTLTPPGASTHVGVPLAVAYDGLLTASVEKTIGEAVPDGNITYTITLTNLGNAPTTVRFAMPDPVANGWNATVPNSIVLDRSAQSGGTDFSKQVAFTVHTPSKDGWNNAQTTFQFKATPASVIDASRQGNPITVNVLARVRGCSPPGSACAPPLDSLGSGSVAGPLSLLVVLGCAVVTRRRA